MKKEFSVYWDGASFSEKWQQLDENQKFALLKENFFPEKEKIPQNKAETLCQVLSTKEKENPAVFQFSDEHTQELLGAAFNAHMKSFRNLLFQRNQWHRSLWFHLSPAAAHYVVDMLQATRKTPAHPCNSCLIKQKTR